MLHTLLNPVNAEAMVMKMATRGFLVQTMGTHEVPGQGVFFWILFTKASS